MTNYLFGLGNPGKEYLHTRHNVGFEFVEYFAQKIHAPAFLLQSKFQAEVTQMGEWYVAKPQTFMNDSGRSVHSVLQFFQKDWLKNNEYAQVWVAHDDLDLQLGSFKIQKGTGPKVHNGLNSIYQHLHSEEFWHIRLGVDGRGGERTIPGRDYVLSTFPAEEQKVVEQMFESVMQKLLDHVK
jgi:PTH1 family peptidyl-tRNA hydrolase